MPVSQVCLKEFAALVQACGEGAVSLVEANDTATGKTVWAVCAKVSRSGEVYYRPLAVLMEGDPEDRYQRVTDGLTVDALVISAEALSRIVGDATGKPASARPTPVRVPPTGSTCDC